jgi:hypothetical protein
MGHISSAALHKLKYVASSVGEMVCNKNMNNCVICAKAKLTKKSFNKDCERASRVCEIIHCDLMGPITPRTFVKQSKYIMCVLDDYSRYLQVFVIKSKTETVLCMNEALRMLQAQYPGPGQFNILRCDQGTEFTNVEMSELLVKYGITCEESEAYCHEHNGAIERTNRTIAEKNRALLFESGFPVGLWGLATHAACYLYNRTPHSAIDFVTPYEMFFGKEPDLSNIRIFGSLVECFDSNIPKGRKFQSRTNTRFLAGFTKTGYTVFDPETKKTENVCNVSINESILYKNRYSSLDNENLVIPESSCQKCKSVESSSLASCQEGDLLVEQKEVDTLVLQGGFNSPSSSSAHLESHSDDEISVREFELDDDWSEDEMVQVKSCVVSSSESGSAEFDKNLNVSTELPLTYTEAMSGENALSWGPPIQAELDAMTKYKVWSIVPRTKEMRVIPLKWVFAIKTCGKRKARLVAVGCRDKEVYTTSDTASPTPTAATIRWLLVIAVRYGWYILQLDVINAFLNGDIDRLKYVSIPQGMDRNQKKFVCKLHKSLYGLATAPMC